MSPRGIKYPAYNHERIFLEHVLTATNENLTYKQLAFSTWLPFCSILYDSIINLCDAIVLQLISNTHGNC